MKLIHAFYSLLAVFIVGYTACPLNSGIKGQSGTGYFSMPLDNEAPFLYGELWVPLDLMPDSDYIVVLDKYCLPGSGRNKNGESVISAAICVTEKTKTGFWIRGFISPDASKQNATGTTLFWQAFCPGGTK